MKVIMKVFSLTSCFVLFLIVVLQGEAIACSCVRPGPSETENINSAVKDSAAVISGEVVEITENTQFSKLVKININSVWKGSKKRQIEITTGNGGGDCGFPFEVGEIYLIFANGSKGGEYSTNICNRTNLLSLSETDLKVLKKPKYMFEHSIQVL
jgi:hypothetical protein